MLRVTQAILPDFAIDSARARMQSLTEEARRRIPADLAQDNQLELLIELFYRTWGFGGVGGVYRLADTLWLDNVLARRQGLFTSLVIILLHIAQALGIPLMPDASDFSDPDDPARRLAGRRNIADESHQWRPAGRTYAGYLAAWQSR